MDKLEDYAIKNVAKGSFIIFLGVMFSSIIFLFYKVLAARYLGPSDYGLLILGITILNIASVLGLVGLIPFSSPLFRLENRLEIYKSIGKRKN